MRPIITLLIVFLLDANALLYGQSRWAHRDSIWRDPGASIGYSTIFNAGLQSLRSDSPIAIQTLLTKYVFAYAPTEGTSLHTLPLNKTAYGDALFYPSKYGTVFTYWDGYNNNAHRIYVKRRDSTTWTEAFPGAMPGHVPYSAAVFDSSIVISNSKYGTFFAHSSDLGRTWRAIDMGFVGDSSPTRIYRNQFNVSDSVLACWRNTGYREFDLTTAKQSYPSLPKRTGVYARSGRRVLGTTVYTDSAHPARLFTSADSGATWSFIDTVDLASSGSHLTPSMNDGKAFEGTHIHRRGDSTFIITTQGRQLLITTDAGMSWRACSGDPRTSFMLRPNTDENKWFDMSDTTVLVVHLSHLYTINIPKCTLVQRQQPLASMGSVTLLKNGELIVPSCPAVFASLDTGRTWAVLPWPRGATWNESLSRSTTISHAFVNTVHSFGPDSADVYSIDYGATLRLFPGSERRAQVLNGGLPLYPLDNVSTDASQSCWTAYLNQGQLFTKLGGDSLLFLQQGVSLSTAGRRDSILTPKGRGWSALWATMFSPSDWWMQIDSLHRSTDSGRTWRAADEGLPRDQNNDVTPMSSLKRLYDGTLLAGFRGLRKATLVDSAFTDTSLVREGGIWRSIDNGAHWQRSDVGLESDRYVWWIEPLPSGAILAVAGNMLYDAGNSSRELNGWNLGGARIFRSDDNGRTWSVVYAETRDHMAYPGRRPILRTSAGRILAATMDNGVIESGDDGRTWHEVGEDLYGRMINDIDEDSTGTIWVATDNGIWSWQPTTPVDEPYVNGKYTSVWAYPTPARNEVIIRLNNLNLLTTDAPHLYLYDITGVRRADLSDHVLANRSSERVEFAYPTISLERGVYLLVLETGRGYETMKISIWK